MRSERGMTLVEMLVAMTVFLVVLGGTLGTMQSQARSFRRGADESAILQNLRFGSDLMSQELRAAGSNVPDEQPPLVYASSFSFAFNADYVSRTPGDESAVQVDPDAPAGQVSVLTQAMSIPGSAPAFSYPSKVYKSGASANSPAETITFFFELDPETARGDDYVLRRQVNNGPSEPVVRNVLAYTGRPFFRYHSLNVTQAGVQSTQLVPDNWLPLTHSVTNHALVADTGVFARVDSLRAVEVSYSVTNGRSGAQERIRQISTVIPLPNLMSKKLKSCGHEPVFTQVVTAAVSASGLGIDLQWSAAVDDVGGEKDVLRYVIWRRVTGTADWGDPVATVPTGNATYTFSDAGLTTGASYDYAVAAQDCTPSLSSQRTVLGVVAP